MNPIIKWPGGKSREIGKIEPLIPRYNRYIEPFFGGGALFFHLQPRRASINDISQSLIEYYRLIKEQDDQLYSLLMCYANSFRNVLSVCEKNYGDIFSAYNDFARAKIDKKQLKSKISELSTGLSNKINSGFAEKLLLNEELFLEYIIDNVTDKFARTIRNNRRSPYSDEDLKSNLLTGFTSGYYMYFREVFNDINLGRREAPSLQYKAANFYFIREYCYGSMFRYNTSGEFNIPYGGMTYNTKNFKLKIDNMFGDDVEKVFKNTDISCCDFEQFIMQSRLTENDFVFLDPPYDSAFSDYEGNSFSKIDQERLAHSLKKILARFILVIKNTSFIHDLYSRDFSILSFDNKYTYNMRSRNERETEHLIITNLPV